MLAAVATAQGAEINLGGLSNVATPSGTTAVVNGISTSDVFGYDSGVWHATIADASLANQVSVTDGSLRVQVGAVAPTGKGNWLGVKIDATQLNTETPQTVSFDWVKDAAWGTGSYSATFTVEFVGFNEDGVATSLGSWNTTLDNSAPSGTSDHVDMTLNVADGEYASYGVLISAIENTDVTGGCGMTITNLTLQTTPEPTTATLSLLALAGLCARRRRK